MESPCKNCTFETGRYLGCQDHCTKPERLKYVELLNIAKKNKSEERNKDLLARTLIKKEKRLKDWGDRYYG